MKMKKHHLTEPLRYNKGSAKNKVYNYDSLHFKKISNNLKFLEKQEQNQTQN
jgi:hypothetical protein